MALSTAQRLAHTGGRGVQIAGLQKIFDRTGSLKFLCTGSGAPPPASLAPTRTRGRASPEHMCSPACGPDSSCSIIRVNRLWGLHNPVKKGERRHTDQHDGAASLN